jgi:Ca2+/H+ antiporter
MEQLNTVSVLPVGPNFLEHVRALQSWIREVVTYGVCLGAASALAIAYLRSDADLCAME